MRQRDIHVALPRQMSSELAAYGGRNLAEARWFGQPLGVSFSTKENPDDFGVKVKLLGDWQQPPRLHLFTLQITVVVTETTGKVGQRGF
jgi:uncharacterized protein YhdP